MSDHEEKNQNTTGGPSNPKTEAPKHSLVAQAAIQKTFPQGCEFSPDGLCILTAQNHELMLYNTGVPGVSAVDAWKPVLKCAAGDAVRSYAWYPHMSSSNPSTCCFAGVARDQPAHLYDAYTGAIRATYRPYNGLDEMESPNSLSFANNGQQLILGGFRTDRMLHVFDLNRPGRDPTIVLKLGKTRRSRDGQKGLVSALASASVNNSNPSYQPNLLAVGTYSPGSIYLYDLRSQASPVSELVISGTCVVGHGKAHSRKRKHFIDPDDDQENGDLLNFSAAKVQWYQNRTRCGVTQVEFSRDQQQYLFSCSRRSNAVLQWDLRRLSSASSTFCPGVASYATCNDTNQRLEFAIDEKDQLWIGGQDGRIRVYETQRSPHQESYTDEKFQLDGFGGAVNGISLASPVPGQPPLLATAVGSRRYPSYEDWDKDDPHGSVEDSIEGWLKLYSMKPENGECAMTKEQ